MVPSMHCARAWFSAAARSSSGTAVVAMLFAGALDLMRRSAVGPGLLPLHVTCSATSFFTPPHGSGMGKDLVVDGVVTTQPLNGGPRGEGPLSSLQSTVQLSCPTQRLVTMLVRFSVVQLPLANPWVQSPVGGIFV